MLLLTFSAWSLGCAPRATPPPEVAPTRGYILISFDTLRADHLGAYGYERDTSPVFDRLAQRAVLFERALVQYPSTLTSHMSIFTGLYPQEHQVLPPSGVLSADVETLPERFRAHGFRTAGHTEGGFVAGGFGFRRGFEQFTDAEYQADTDIERTFERGLEFLRRLALADRFFLFLHTYSVHDPYLPPTAYRALFWPGEPPDVFASTGENLHRVNRGELQATPRDVQYFRAQYDASIRYADEVLGRFVDELESLGLLADTTLVVTSDHGEEFLEHGKLAHTQVYPECVWVPLLIVHPRMRSARRVARVVETVDLAPTLYQLAGLPAAGDLSGESLMRDLWAEPAAGASGQGYAEVLDVRSMRTLVAGDGEALYQLLLVEPERDPVGPWLGDPFAFDAERETLEFEARSFHQPRVLTVSEGERLRQRFEIGTRWQPVRIELPPGPEVRRLTLGADGCVSPAAVGAGDDDRCLGIQLRGLAPRRFELYDLDRDPGARAELSRRRPEVRRRLADRLLGLRWSPRAAAGERTLSAEERRALKALGYLD